EIEQTLRQAANPRPESADAAALARIEEIRIAAASALDRIRRGEIWQRAAPPYGQIISYVASSFVWALTPSEDHVENVAEFAEARVFEDLLDTFAKGRAPTLMTPTERWRDEIGMKADPRRYAELLRRGELSVGGGTTTDMQWSLSFRDGRYL